MLLILGGILILVEVLVITIWGAAVSLVELLMPVVAIGMIAVMAKQLAGGAKSALEVLLRFSGFGVFMGIVGIGVGLLLLLAEEPGLLLISLVVTAVCLVVAIISRKIYFKKKQKVSDEKSVQSIQEVHSSTAKSEDRSTEEKAEDEPIIQETCWW